ncbi:MAG TPA: UDP-glucose--hexose-1-phosphate uridylyltransferase [Candidatus Sumerlaeota bacterium]|nr:UDP-glucose--hexose-1-phosphate uridylyltransferase [Candidatus Sumerlaeota bacterium]
MRDAPFNPADHPHRRRNALTGEWVLVSPHRAQRPWRGGRETPPADSPPAYDPACYLCPGNERAGGARNPHYADTFVFTNDYTALLPEAPAAGAPDHPLLTLETVRGVCRVICFSPRHDLTLAQMDQAAVRRVVDVWIDQTLELGRQWRWVQVFENKGALMGCSNPHPHGQIWAGDALPNEPAREDAEQRRYFTDRGRPLLLDYAQLELDREERVIVQNEDWLAVVPFWAVWPFELLLLPRRRQIRRLPELSDSERGALAEILRRLLIRYDNLFQIDFPYSMGWHGAPFGDDGDEATAHWQLHAHFYPPLLRSATLRKFLVGYEMLAEVQRDITPEQAANRLRAAAEIHFAASPSDR